VDTDTSSNFDTDSEDKIPVTTNLTKRIGKTYRDIHSKLEGLATQNIDHNTILTVLHHLSEFIDSLVHWVGTVNKTQNKTQATQTESRTTGF